MQKIAMTTPLVEMDGDEMTRVVWGLIKQELLLPYIELKTEYYDLSLQNRDATEDQVTQQAAQANKKYGVGVKCATITPNAQQAAQYHLKQQWKSPNGTIRAVLDGTVFRAPILLDCVKPLVRSWEKPITIARHAFGDLYKASEIRVESPGRAELVFTAADGTVQRQVIHEFDGPGVLQGSFNLDRSIQSFAKSCFEFAVSSQQDLLFCAKDTISKQYDARFRQIFQQMYEQEYTESFARLGLRYQYTLIDAAVAKALLSRGGFIWACKNYDGDVMSDMLSTAFGSIAMMTSVLVSPDGCYEYEAAHGTVPDHYTLYQQGQMPGTNPMATIFAWTGALARRGSLDDNAMLVHFAQTLETACLDTLNQGIMTGDLCSLAHDITPTQVNCAQFIAAVRRRLEELLPG